MLHTATPRVKRAALGRPPGPGAALAAARLMLAREGPEEPIQRARRGSKSPPPGQSRSGTGIPSFWCA